MFDTLALNLISGGLASAGGMGIQRVRDFLRRRRFADTIDGLSTEFTTALKNAVTEAIDTEGRDELAELEQDWKAIAKELEGLDVIFENEEDAIVRVTDAIATGLDIDLATRPNLREELEAAVAEAYQVAIQEFVDRVAGTELADVLATEINLELASTAEVLNDRLTAIQRQLRRHETVALRNAGFIRLDPLYFEREEPSDPETAWRIGFGFQEVAAGYPLPRHRPAESDSNDRQYLTTEILDRLDSGDDLVVIGEGGSGKSTICKQVAYEWHTDTDRGPVFYRTSDKTAVFEDPGTLIEAVRAAEDEVLITVEDAAEGNSTAVFDLLDEFEHAEDVSFLLDSRKNTWQNPEGIVGTASLEYQRQRLLPVEIPPLDDLECQRAIEYYESLTDKETGVSPKSLYEEALKGDIGGALIVAYRLTGPPTNSESDEVVSALHADVRDAYRTISEWADDDFSRTVATMVNILNAAELSIDPVFIHALAEDTDDHQLVDRTVDFLNGIMVDTTDEEIKSPHRQWSALYLERLLDQEGKRTALNQFERCLEVLFELVDDPESREEIRTWYRGTPRVLEVLDENPEDVADVIVRSVAKIGRGRRRLGVLHETDDRWRLDLPEACSAKTRNRWLHSRGQIHIERGALDAAQTEFSRLRNLTDPDSNGESDKSWYATTLGNLGIIAQNRGNFDNAEEYFEEGLDVLREVGSRQEVAQAFQSLGNLASSRGNHEEAKEYYEKSLSIHHENGNDRSTAGLLHNIGIIAKKEGDIETCEEYSQKSLNIFRDLGYRPGQALCLNSLGTIAQIRGNLETAEKYYEQSLALKREAGDRDGEARSLINLGSISENRGNWDTAEEYIQEGLTIYEKIGNRAGEAEGLKNLGEIAQARGNLKKAKEHYAESFDIFQDIGSDKYRAVSLNDLGLVSLKLGNLDEAEEYLNKSLDLHRKVGSIRGAGNALANLGFLALERGDLDAAEEYQKESLALNREMGDRQGQSQTLIHLGAIAQERGDPETAKKFHEASLLLKREIGDQHGEAQCIANLGIVAKMQGDLETARERLATAAKRFLTTGAFNDVDTIFPPLIQVCSQLGDHKAAQKWCKEAITVAEQTNDEKMRTEFQHRLKQLASETTEENNEE